MLSVQRVSVIPPYLRTSGINVKAKQTCVNGSRRDAPELYR